MSRKDPGKLQRSPIKHSDSDALSQGLGAGASFAFTPIMAGVLALLPAIGMGCVVTDKKDFVEEENFPTAILEAPGSGLHPGQSLWIDREEGDGAEWEFDVIVMDANERDELAVRSRVIRADDRNPAFVTQTLPPGRSETRELTLRITPSQIYLDTCHVLDVVAARKENFFRFDDPNPGNFDFVEGETAARMMWTILEGNRDTVSDDAKALLGKSCAALFDEQLTPSTLSTGMAGGQP